MVKKTCRISIISQLSKNNFVVDSEGPRDLIALNRLNKLITRDTNFWVGNTFIGYIIEFIRENNESISKVEKEIKRVERGRLMKDVLLWIKN